MKGRNLNHARPSEPRPAEAEMQQLGLRVLGRMIARMYVHETRARNEAAPEHGGEISPEAGGDSRNHSRSKPSTSNRKRL